MNQNITAERLKQLVRYEPSNGNFYWLVQRGPKRPGDIAGSLTNQGYRQLALDRQSFRANRMAFLYINGVMPTGVIDHINGNRSDDRWENLREVTASMNSQNMRHATRKSKSGVLGVFFLKRKQKWTARLRRKGKDYYIGFLTQLRKRTMHIFKRNASFMRGAPFNN